jgi:FtsP/CotA-like multicopper oxidase with cupredoxin domain
MSNLALLARLMIRLKAWSWMCACLIPTFLTGISSAQTDPADLICPRSEPGTVLEQPADLYSSRGKLDVTLHFRRATDRLGLVRYCYVSDEGEESPTLHVRPGDRLLIHLKNDLAAGSKEATRIDACDSSVMNPDATNIHFHGTNTAPVCHQDEVIRTLVPPGQTFDYDVPIPKNAAPGLYWYHPHPHGSSESQVLGGATGALIIDGIETQVPSVIGLPQAVIVLRDQLVTATASANAESEGLGQPGWDVSVNYSPVTFPNYVTPTMRVKPDEQQLWRIANTSANSIFILQYLVNGQSQALKLAAVDGVPIPTGPETRTKIQLGPGARAEFVVITPKSGETGDLVSLAHDTGPDGESDPVRPLIKIMTAEDAPELHRLGKVSSGTSMRSGQVLELKPAIERTLYFSEERQGADFSSPVNFFITVEGQTPQTFSMGQKPNIVLRSGTVEDWTIENRTRESHVFHIHQIHFRVLEIDGHPVDDAALRDTIEVPWSEAGAPYHKVKLRMDFRDPNIVGTFLFQCHIMQHEAGGMMGKIQVLPAR